MISREIPVEVRLNEEEYKILKSLARQTERSHPGVFRWLLKEKWSTEFERELTREEDPYRRTLGNN